MGLNKIIRRDNVVVLRTKEEPNLGIEVHDLEQGVDVMEETEAGYDVGFMGDITPEHGEFDIPGFQIVSYPLNKCYYKISIEEDQSLALFIEMGKSSAAGEFKECPKCNGYSCRYSPPKRLKLRDKTKETEI